MAAEKPNPMKLYTDLDLRGNVLRRAYIENPERNNDPVPKQYSDDQVTFNTEWANKFKKPLIDVGGLSTDFVVNGLRIKEILDQLLFPVIPPVYKESEITVLNEPLRVLIGIPGQHRTYIDIATNDRTSALTNVTCRSIDPYGNEVTNVSPRNNQLENVECNFSPIAIDPDGLTQLQVEVLMSSGLAKVNNHGVTSPNILFESQRLITKKVEYRGFYPVFYSIIDASVIDPVNIHSFISWQELLDNLSFFDPINYEDGIGYTEIDWVIGTDEPKNIIMFVPTACLGFFVNNEDLLECCDTQDHELLIPNTKNGQRVPYTAIKFTTGDSKYTKEKRFKVRFRSEGIAWKDRLIINDYMSENNGHIIVDDNFIEYPKRKKLLITNAAVENNTSKDTTIIHVHAENAPFDGGYFDE